MNLREWIPFILSSTLTETILFISSNFLQRVHSGLALKACLFLSPELTRLVLDMETSSPERTETSVPSVKTDSVAQHKLVLKYTERAYDVGIRLDFWISFNDFLEEGPLFSRLGARPSWPGWVKNASFISQQLCN